MERDTCMLFQDMCYVHSRTSPSYVNKPCDNDQSKHCINHESRSLRTDFRRKNICLPTAVLSDNVIQSKTISILNSKLINNNFKTKNMIIPMKNSFIDLAYDFRDHEYIKFKDKTLNVASDQRNRAILTKLSIFLENRCNNIRLKSDKSGSTFQQKPISNLIIIDKDKRMRSGIMECENVFKIETCHNKISYNWKNFRRLSVPACTCYLHNTYKTVDARLKDINKTVLPECCNKKQYVLRIFSKYDSNANLVTFADSRSLTTNKTNFDVNIFLHNILVFILKMSSNVPINLKLIPKGQHLKTFDNKKYDLEFNSKGQKIIKESIKKNNLQTSTEKKSQEFIYGFDGRSPVLRLQSNPRNGSRVPLQKEIVLRFLPVNKPQNSIEVIMNDESNEIQHRDKKSRKKDNKKEFKNKRKRLVKFEIFDQNTKLDSKIKSEVVNDEKSKLRSKFIQSDKNLRIKSSYERKTKNISSKKKGNSNVPATNKSTLTTGTINKKEIHALSNNKELSVKLQLNDDLASKGIKDRSDSVMSFKIFSANKTPRTILLSTNFAQDLKFIEPSKINGIHNDNININVLSSENSYSTSVFPITGVMTERVSFQNNEDVSETSPKKSLILRISQNKSSFYSQNEGVFKKISTLLPNINSLQNILVHQASPVDSHGSKLHLSIPQANSKLFSTPNSNLVLDSENQEKLFSLFSSSETFRTPFYRGSYEINFTTGEISYNSRPSNASRRGLTTTEYLTPVCQGSYEINLTTGEISCSTQRVRDTQETFAALPSGLLSLSSFPRYNSKY